MKVLLHICCAPCACACVPRLREEGYEVAMFFSNSNIATRDEWEKRLESAKKLAIADDVELIVDEYDHEAWLRDVAAGFENEKEKGARCPRCFHFSFLRAAEYARDNGYDYFTTSLTISPHKVSEVIFERGRDAAKEKGSRFLEVNFKKKEGFKKSVIRACELGLYRQSFCGCEFSRFTNG